MMESPRLSNRLASKRKVMEKEGKDVPWKTLIKGTKNKKSDPSPQNRGTPKIEQSLRERKSKSKTILVKKNGPCDPKKSASSPKVTENHQNENVTKNRKGRPKITPRMTEVLDGPSATCTRNETIGDSAELVIPKPGSSNKQDNAEVVSMELDVSEDNLVENSNVLVEMSLDDIPNAKDAEVSHTEERVIVQEEMTTVNDISGELYKNDDAEVQPKFVEEPVTSDIQEINANPESILNLPCSLSEDDANISSENCVEQPSSSDLPPQNEPPHHVITVGNSEIQTVNEVAPKSSVTESTNDIRSDSDANAEDQSKESTVTAFTIEGQTATPVRNALLDIIMKRQQLREDNNASVVAATIPHEDVPPGSMEQVQDVLGWVAMESNVEFMLTDKMVLVYGNWQEVEKARLKLTELRKQRENEEGQSTTVSDSSGKITPIPPETASANSEQDTLAQSNQEASTSPVEIHIEGLQEFSNGNTEDNSIILQMVEPDEEGQRELEESGVQTLLDQQSNVVYRRSCTFVKDREKACYTCLDCGFRSTKQGVAKHRMRLHNDLQHSCIVCGLTFGMRYDMRCHRLSHFDIDGNLLRKAFPLWSAVNPNMEPVHLRQLEKGFQVKTKALDKMKESTSDEGDSAAGDLSWMMSQIKDDENPKALSGAEKPKNLPGDDDADATGKEDAEVSGDAAQDEAVHIMEGEDGLPATGETKVVYVVQRKKQESAICNICDYRGLVAAVRKHCERQHPLFTYKCPVCEKKCGVVNDMQRHLQGHPEYAGSTNSKVIRGMACCEQCDYVNDTRIMRNHLKTAHGSPLQFTEIAEPGPWKFKFNGSNTMQAQGNITLPKDNERFACEICNKEILLSRYKHHMKSHDEGWKCDICDFSSRSKTAMLQHRQKLHSTGYLDCSMCDKKFSTESSLKFHQSSVHNREASRVICQVCNKIFATERFLKVHIQRIHQRVKRYFCDICEKGFYEKVRMLEHRVVHGSEEEKDSLKKWKCSFCDRRFRTRFCAKQHENCHTGRKPFKCRHCPRTFAWKSEAQKHEISLHTEGNNFNCHLCGRGFKFQYKLNTHMALHNKSTKNMCKNCGKCFTIPATLRNHNCKSLIAPLVINQSVSQSSEVNGSNEAVEYLCGFCNKAFESVDDIVQHMSEVHESHGPLLSTNESDPDGNVAVAMETEESNVEMMYIPKDEEIIVLSQNSEPGSNSNVIQETVTVGADSYQYETPQNNSETQILQVDENGMIQDSRFLKRQLVSDSAKVIADTDSGTVEIIIENGEIGIDNASTLPTHTQLVIVDDHKERTTL